MQPLNLPVFGKKIVSRNLDENLSKRAFIHRKHI